MTRTIRSVKSARSRFNNLDGLRAIAAIGIVVTHVLANINYDVRLGIVSERIIPSFAYFVFLFMVLSGFGMCCGYYDKVMSGKISFVDFYKKRFKKIWPYFAFLVILDVVISPSVPALYEAFADLTLCFGFLGDPMEINVIGVGWFLGLVFVFYMIFPFFCTLLSSKKKAWLVFFLSIVLNFVAHEHFLVGKANMLYSAMFFVAGGLLFLYRDSLSRFANKFRWPLLFSIVLILTWYYVLGEPVLVTLLLSVVFIIYNLGDRHVLMENIITRFISSVSLEIYLCHMVVFRVLERIGILHVFGSNEFSFLFVSVATVIGSIIFAIVTKWAIQKISRLILCVLSSFLKTKKVETIN